MANRRPSGDGTIRKRSDGRWEARIVVGHKDNGSPIFQYIYSKSQKKLVLKLHQMQELYQDVDLTEGYKMTLREWLDQWINDYKSTSIRPNTIKSYKSMIKNYVNPSLGNKQLNQINALDIQKLYSKVKDCGRKREHPDCGSALSSHTVVTLHCMLHNAMDTAVSAHLIAINPTEGAVPPALEPKEMKILDESQQKAFLEAAKREPLWYDLFYTELTTGLRLGEICCLTWADFIPDKGILCVKHTVCQSDNGQTYLGDTKTESGNRQILLPASTRKILLKRKKEACSLWIFPNLRKPEEPMKPNHVYRMLKSLLRDAGLPDIRFHDLRHTFATQAIASGVDTKTLSGILGHTNASFTLDRYTHVTGEMQKQAANVICNFLQNTLGEVLKPWEENEKMAREQSENETMADGKAAS